MQAKSKKDAKQLAAAALLEVMLDHVPFQDLLYKSEKQQSFKDIQVWTAALPLFGKHQESQGSFSGARIAHSSTGTMGNCCKSLSHATPTVRCLA